MHVELFDEFRIELCWRLGFEGASRQTTGGSWIEPRTESIKEARTDSSLSSGFDSVSLSGSSFGANLFRIVWMKDWMLKGVKRMR